MSRYKWRKLVKDCHQLMVEYDKTRDPRRATLLRLLYQVRMENRIPDVWYKLKELLKKKAEGTTVTPYPEKILRSRGRMLEHSQIWRFRSIRNKEKAGIITLPSPKPKGKAC